MFVKKGNGLKWEKKWDFDLAFILWRDVSAVTHPKPRGCFVRRLVFPRPNVSERAFGEMSKDRTHVCFS